MGETNKLGIFEICIEKLYHNLSLKWTKSELLKTPINFSLHFQSSSLENKALIVL